MNNWKTTAAAVPFLVIGLLLHLRTISAQDAVALLGAVGAYLATVAGDAKPKA